MLGYFGGKGDKAPMPGAPNEEDATKPKPRPKRTLFQTSMRPKQEQQEEAEPEFEPEQESEGPSETEIIRDRLRILKKAVGEKKARNEAKVRAVKELHAKQAAYGRDTTQKRAKKAGYVTESEKLMGGRTGYGGLVEVLDKAVDKAADNIKEATLRVTQLTEDVNKGLATRAELKQAMADLDRRIGVAQGISKRISKTRELKGYGEEKKGLSPLWLLLGVGAAYLLLKPKT